MSCPDIAIYKKILNTLVYTLDTVRYSKENYERSTSLKLFLWLIDIFHNTN
jgi:hypothetical protein